MEKLDFDIPSALQKKQPWTPARWFRAVLSKPTPIPDSMPLAAAAVKATYGDHSILPIEFFKYHADELRQQIPTPVVRSFLSSGTTRADRSQSHFSEAGLQCYRKFSLETFQAVLAHYFPEPMKIKGLSLIPSVHEWPDSSLAQMVDWIGKEHDLVYWDGLGSVPKEPVWVFGTAFHFVNLADDGIRWQLPTGSLVIETGGTKGRSRSVTRQELYDLIEEHLGVPKNRIISEYGMCELASQAYDFVDDPEGPELRLEERWFRFPFFTPVSLVDRLSQKKTQGEGTLVIHDPLRTDFPWPIRTEDMARVRADGAFQLLGRVPLSPLKGCSMLAEQISGGHGVQELPVSKVIAAPVHWEERAAAVHAIAQKLLQDEIFWDLWLQELGNAQAVTWLREDMRSSLPRDPQAWIQAAQTAQGKHCPARWLIIPADSHSYAWLYPVLLGSVLGLQLFIRAKTQDPLLNLVRERLKYWGGLHIWDAQKRIGIDLLPPVDALMIFGSDETLAAIRKLTALPIQGFGSYVTASLLLEKDWESAQKMIWKDALSLMQKACMASRVAFLLQEEDSTPLPQFSASSSPLGELPLGLELALEHGTFAQRCSGLSIPQRTAEGRPLVMTQVFDSKKTLADYLLDRAMSLSLILIPKNLWQEFSMWLGEQKNLKKIAAHPEQLHLPLDTERFELAAPGSANAPAWNGLHQKRPLFGLG